MAALVCSTSAALCWVISSICRTAVVISSMAPAWSRLSRAMAWTSEFVPPEDRTIVRSEPDTERLASLSERERQWLALLVDGLAEMPEELDLSPVTALVYGVPKLAHGMPVDADPTDEVKADQKAFFRLLYNLLVGKDRGPRLPTLIVALGTERVRGLLAPTA